MNSIHFLQCTRLSSLIWDWFDCHLKLVNSGIIDLPTAVKGGMKRIEKLRGVGVICLSLVEIRFRININIYIL